ncbi:MAG TPA: hypothetical protein DD417_20430 [Elusimicrobia bacterium]|nr:hypothetical protein [Elusimicrobiota bacterium]
MGVVDMAREYSTGTVDPRESKSAASHLTVKVEPLSPYSMLRFAALIPGAVGAALTVVVSLRRIMSPGGLLKFATARSRSPSLS